MKLLQFLLLFTAFVLSSCADIIEPDISSKKVEIKSPADGVVLQSLTPTFSWYPLDNATKYNIQIAFPSFAHVKILRDTTIVKTEYTKQLTSGNFEWRVRAVNNNYLGAFTDIRKFTIDSSLNIFNQVVSLSSPTKNSGEYSNHFTQTLTWQALSIAKTYHVKITDTDNSTTIIYGITDIKYPITFTKEGTYSWSVQAVDEDFASNKFASPATFYIDKTNPVLNITNDLKDSLVHPTDSLIFTWTSTDNKLLKADSIVFYGSDSTVVTPSYSAQYVAPTVQKFKLLKPTTLGTFWFNIVGVDAAGNIGRTKKRKFKVVAI